MEKCKKRVFKDWHSHRCTRNAWKDGFCKQHHPETVKARDAEASRRYVEKQASSPWALLKKAEERIAELESELKELRGK